MPSPDQLLSIARAYLPTPAADGSLWFASDLPGVSQLFRLEGPDRFPVRFEPSRERLLPVVDTPAGLVVRQDTGSSERFRLGLLRDGGVRALTHDPMSFYRDRVPSPDRRFLGVSHNPGGGPDMHLGALDVTTGEITPWSQRPGSWAWVCWAPDGTSAIVQHAGRDLHVLHPDGNLTPLLVGGDVGEICRAGKHLLVVSTDGRDTDALVEVDPITGTETGVLLDDGCEIVAVVPDPAGARVAVALNRGAFDEIRVIDLVSGEVTGVWSDALPPGLLYRDNSAEASRNLRWDTDGSRLFASWDSPVAPAEIVELPSGTRWTYASGAPIRGLRDAQDVAFPSFDGLEIPALHYRVDGTPRPTLVLFHGGPNRQSRGTFQPITAMFNAAGFDVLAVNFRGSSGYGRHFTALDDRELRWDAVRDGCAAGHWLRDAGHATELVAMGGSYGGFMTLAVMVEDPALWDAGIAMSMISDWQTWFARSHGWQRPLRVHEYGDPEGPDREFLARYSPLRRAGEITAPLLLIHGRNDVRVAAEEAEQMHAAVDGSQLLVLEDEGHGITKHANRVTAYGRALAFAQEHVGRRVG